MSILKNFNALATSIDDHYFKFLGVALLFLLLAFDQNLGIIYILIMVVDKWWHDSDNFISFPMSRQEKSWQVYLESLIGLGVFLTLSIVLTSWLAPESMLTGGIVESTQSIFRLLATTTPIFAHNDILTFIGWTFFVPIIETRFFNGRLLEGLSTYAEKIIGRPISLQKYSLHLIVVIGIVATLFTLFHVQSKGLTAIPLLITFIFSVISSMLVIRHRELKGAVWMHIIVNGFAVSTALKWINV